MTRLSNEERRTVIERFFERVSEGIPVDQEWMARMIEASAPRLPSEPTKEQLDAWIELSEIVSDEGFVDAMRANATDTWGGDFDLEASRDANEEAVGSARAALDQGVAPDSDDARPIAERLVVGTAAAMHKDADRTFRRWMLDKNESHDPRAARYWVLVGIINEQPQMADSVDEWQWLTDALKAHLSN